MPSPPHLKTTKQERGKEEEEKDEEEKEENGKMPNRLARAYASIKDYLRTIRRETSYETYQREGIDPVRDMEAEEERRRNEEMVRRRMKERNR